MTWEELIDLYLKACGNTADAAAEKWDHFNYALRKLCAMIDMQELHITGLAVPTVANQDYVTLNSAIYSVDLIFNKTTGHKLDPEPDGMRGRARYLEETTAKPPTGEVSFYAIKNTRIYLRDTPDSIDALVVDYKKHPDAVSDSDLALSPVSPNQYDFALLKFACANYFELHPPALPTGEIDYNRAVKLEQGAMKDLADTRNPQTDENLDRRQWVRQPGYSFNLRGR